MWMKNLAVYRLKGWTMDIEALAAALAPHAFVACTSAEAARTGWTSPRKDDQLVYKNVGQLLLALKTESKIMPAGSINAILDQRCADHEENAGFYPGKMLRREMRERIVDELLPRALSKYDTTFVWIDMTHGWLVVDAASNGKADHAIKCLLKSIDGMPIESLRVNRSPSAVMTAWLETDEAPHGFTVDQDCELHATGNSRATVRYTKATLEVDEMRRHIAAGKQCTRLALTWNDKVSFTLTESLNIKGVAPLDIIRETDAAIRNDAERFDNDFVLMTGEYAKMLDAIVEALGGEYVAPEAPKERAAATGDEAVLAVVRNLKGIAPSLTINVQTSDIDPYGVDNMYDQAVKVVLDNRRASISLVQRHLHIGYNRAARLLETMEQRGVVSAMESNGNREILTKADAA